MRALRLAWLILYAVVIGPLLPMLSAHLRGRIVQSWARDVLAALHIRIHLHGELARGCMVLANHVSWLDILMLNALAPARFVAKAEIRRWPLIGRLAASAGTFFIRRQRHAERALLGPDLQHGLLAGERIVVFPEGTSTAGHAVLPFHAALLEAAIRTDSRIQPVALRYQLADGRLDTLPAFTGDDTLLASLWRILGRERIHVAIWCASSFRAGALHRREAAAIAYEYVSRTLQRTAIAQTQAIEPSRAARGAPVESAWRPKPGWESA